VNYPQVKPSSDRLFGVPPGVLALGMARMADAMGNSFLIVVLPLYIASGQVEGEALQLSSALVTGIVLGLFGLVSSICQPFVGRLSDRAGRRRIFVVVGLCFFTAANLSYMFAHTYAALVVVRVAQGIAAAMTITASVALVSELSTRADRGGNMGVYNSFRLTGFAVGPLASGALVEGGPYSIPWVGALGGFDAAFVVAAVAAATSCVLVGIFVHDPEDIEPTSERMAVRFRSATPGKLLDSIFALGVATFFMSTGFALLAAIEPEVNERLSQGAFLFAVEFSALVATLAVAQPFVGRATDEYGRKPFIVAGLLALIPTTLAEGLVVDPWQMVAARGLHGLGAAMVFAPALALAGDLADRRQSGAQLSVLTVSFGLGISFGSVVSGYTIRFGFVTPFAVGALLAAVGAAVVQTQVDEPEKAVSGSEKSIIDP